MNTPRPQNIHEAYHAHVYFDQDTLNVATALCEQAGTQFNVKVGRIHQKPVGPHPRWSCQLSFNNQDFDALIPWLESNRQGLSVLVHALTGDDLKDHTTYASWLGESVDLRLAMFENPAQKTKSHQQ